MSFDLSALKEATDTHGPVARIVIVQTKGSAPRDAGTSMLVWQDGQSGTIGGGTLEYQALEMARAQLSEAKPWSRTHRTIPLGPALGQCCGGSVSLLSEVYSPHELAKIDPAARSITRPFQNGVPLRINAGNLTAQRWFSEEIKDHNTEDLWIYGAGHVGRALVQVLAPLGQKISWIDTAQDRFPTEYPTTVTPLIAQNPGDIVPYAPATARHLILTYSHAHDLEICHQLLSHSFAFAGLIGSKTKWARFRSRLGHLGHSPEQISRLTCPIGRIELGKEPMAIAVGVAAELLMDRAQANPPIVKSKEFAQ